MMGGTTYWVAVLDAPCVTEVVGSAGGWRWECLSSSLAFSSSIRWPTYWWSVLRGTEDSLWSLSRRSSSAPALGLSLIHISEPTRLRRISYAVFCLKKKKRKI